MPVQFTDFDDLPGSNPAKSEFGTVPIYDRAAMSRRKRLKASAATPATTATAAAPSRDFTPRTATAGPRGAPTWALVAVPAAIVLAGGAFVLMQPRAANEPETMSVAAMDSVTPQPPASAIPELAPTPDAALEPQAAVPAAAAPVRAERAPEPARVARARPAPRAPAADEASADASTIAPSATETHPVGAQPNPLAVNPAPMAIPSVAQPPVATDAPPAPPAETSGATQEVIPDASAIPQ